ncbi:MULTISPECIES: dTDP-4-dehydrorhamnose 3,5-epimerase family protein [Achromobacter]|uniref:dTDP-4-dehydrorhamnose 3,5-epimerase n=1 Tax=Achromobacter piechaudii TaxID=72556 RepID=A0A6S7EPG5_9BURK|nr:MULTISPECIES: dTDP-4-dehydrorhamnose 3,5-epimerase family protein [Achromobacter]MPS79495.1 dTDP-4-keto-6-deoxy-D-glucose epimerase [Achromobacter sp.]CAB3920922.1 dTDP-4-dehydrorhamnose 3,5-epimerase [Achromobacter piechaudii]
MQVHKTPIPGMCIVTSTAHRDERGAFTRLFCRDTLRHIMDDRQILQINYSTTNSLGAVRGLHFQTSPHAEMKLVRCLRGKVWDVVVDLRSDSPTFLQWHAETLDAESLKMIVIPEGCAHGFQALAVDSELIYLHTALYRPDHEGGLRYDDPALKIAWPLPPTDISIRDRSHPPIDPSFPGVNL